MKIDYVAETVSHPRLRAWLMPDDPDDELEDPTIPRPDGWRLLIEALDNVGEESLIRSAWEPRIETVILNMESYWNSKPVWKIYQTGEVIDLYSVLGISWR